MVDRKISYSGKAREQGVAAVELQTYSMQEWQQDWDSKKIVSRSAKRSKVR